MFINLVKKSFLDVVKNPVITLFLVLYFIIISMLLGSIAFQNNKIIAIVLLATSFLFVAIFIAGWLRVIKEIALRNPEEERTRSYIAIFLEGIGENIIPTLMGLITYVLFSAIFMVAAYFVAMRFFGNPQMLIPDIQNSSSVLDLANLPAEKLNILYGWQLCFSGFACIVMILFLYYFPAIIFDNKTNIFLKAFVALKNNICFLFKHFGISLLIFILLFLINTLVGISKSLSSIFMHNYPQVIVVFEILYILYVIYFLSFSVMLICSYYGKQYSCNNGADCLGEDKGDDKAGENN